MEWEEIDELFDELYEATYPGETKVVRISTSLYEHLKAWRAKDHWERKFKATRRHRYGIRNKR